MRRLLPLLAALLAGCAHERLVTWEKTSCRSYARPVPWSVCVTTGIGSDNRDIVYHLHGGGGSQKDWADPSGYGAQVRRRWEQKAFRPPVVAAVSLGPKWILAERNAAPESGLMEKFVGEIMPEIDLLLDEPPRRRMVVGESMGGFNAAELVLMHPELFDRAALLCPGLSTLPPHASLPEIEGYAFAAGGKPAKVKEAVELMRRYFPDAESWDKASPLALAKKILGPKSPRLYVSCGRSDEYGFMTGARAFAEIAVKAGAKVAWRALDGGHCTVDPRSLADFLAAD